MVKVASGLERRAREALATIPDPEIPAITIADLGMIERVEERDGALEVDLLPTFVGCPAQDVIRADAERALATVGATGVRVRFVFDPPWTTERITPEGREALREFGIAPPGLVQIGAAPVACPICGSRETVLDAEFGPTACRTIRYCRACRNPFEGFKPKLV